MVVVNLGGIMIVLIGILIAVAMYERYERYQHQCLLQDTLEAFIYDRLTVEGNDKDGYSVYIKEIDEN